MSKIKIAISGTIGSGKTTVLDYLCNKGFVVINLDEINNELLKKGNKGYNKIANCFKEVIENGELNKQKLSEIVFNDDTKIKQLNSIMHPMIKEQMLKKIADNQLVIVEVPLLFETDFYKLFDYYLLIIVDEKIAFDRLLKRGVKIDDAKRRIANQMPIEEKIKKANYVIDNSFSKEELYAKIDIWLESINLC